MNEEISSYRNVEKVPHAGIIESSVESKSVKEARGRIRELDALASLDNSQPTEKIWAKKGNIVQTSRAKEVPEQE